MNDIEEQYKTQIRATLHDLIIRRRSSKSVSSLQKGNPKREGQRIEEKESSEGKQTTYKEDDVQVSVKIHPCLSMYIHSSTFTSFVFAVIMIHTGLLVLQTIDSIAVRAEWYFGIVDSLFLGVYIAEMILKLYVLRINYFKDYWNLLDLTVVTVNIVDYILPFLVKNLSAGRFLAFDLLRMLRIFRAIRALRVLRAIRFMTNLQVIMNTCLQSINSMGAIVGLMLLFMYMFAVIGRGMYAHANPARFGSIWKALFTLFQLLTLDNWFTIYEDVVHADPSAGHIIFYLIAYIVIEYLIFLNLFVAVLVDNFQLTLYATQGEIKESKEAKLLQDQDNVSQISEYEALIYSNQQNKSRVQIEEIYPEAANAEKETLTKIFQTMAAIEYNMYLYQQQQNTLNMIVDLCTEQTGTQ